MTCIEEIIAERDAAEARAVDIKNMSASTYQLNEQALEFINNMEEKIPENVVVQSFNATNESISIPGVASSYDDISDFIMNLKTFSFIDDIYVSTISQEEDDAGNIQYNYNLTCVYTNPNASATDAEEE